MMLFILLLADWLCCFWVNCRFVVCCCWLFGLFGLFNLLNTWWCDILGLVRSGCFGYLWFVVFVFADVSFVFLFVFDSRLWLLWIFGLVVLFVSCLRWGNCCCLGWFMLYYDLWLNCLFMMEIACFSLFSY